MNHFLEAIAKCIRLYNKKNLISLFNLNTMKNDSQQYVSSHIVGFFYEINLTNYNTHKVI